MTSEPTPKILVVRADLSCSTACAQDPTVQLSSASSTTGLAGPVTWALSADVVSSKAQWRSTTMGTLNVSWALNLQLDLAMLATKGFDVSAGNVGVWFGMSSPLSNEGAEMQIWPPVNGAVSTAEAAYTACLVSSSDSCGSQTVELPGFDRTADLANDPATCNGVSIAWHQVHTGLGGAQIDAQPGASNTFIAEPSYGRFPTDANTVVARFRLAHWGSQIGLNGTWTPIPGGDDVPNAVGGVIQVTCGGASGNPCPTLGAAQVSHQCMLVELFPHPSYTGQLGIAPHSTFRNLDFLDAEDFAAMGAARSFSDQARLSVDGVEGERALAVWARAVNLPGLVPMQKEPARGIDPRYELGASEKLLAEQAAFEVQVARDTGFTAKAQDRTVRVFAPQVPFGYLIRVPEARTAKWRYELTAVGDTPPLKPVTEQVFETRAVRGRPANVQLVLGYAAAGSIGKETDAGSMDSAALAPKTGKGICSSAGAGQRTGVDAAIALFLLTVTLAALWRTVRRRSP